MDNIYDGKTRKEWQEYFNDRLKTLKTHDEWESFKKEVDDVGIGLWYYLTTKSGGELNGDWKADDDSITYITTATSRVYKCKISNLHKVICIR